MSNTRKYTSNYSIKEFAINDLAPKYFDKEEVGDYNVGLVGYVTDLGANIGEDTFNTIPILMKEIYPNLAQLPESIYNYASLFQETNLMATPSVMDTVILINVDDIKRFATKSPNNNYAEFMIDADTKIEVEEQSFILDYDIRITIKPYKGDFIYTASYVKDYNNGLSDIDNPYIKLQKVIENRTDYVAMLVKVRRCEKNYMSEVLLNNDKINVPVISFSFTDQLANFEVFYRKPGNDNYIQLRKKVLYSHTVKEPFCYYRHKDESTIEISFTTRENYFKPEFNSEIMIRYWTTTGAKGNFEHYVGSNVYVVSKDDKYPYNSSIPMMALPQSASIGGASGMDLEQLQRVVSDNYSTCGAYVTEHDLQIYFNSFKNKYNQDIIFVKKRDDIFDRLFSSFSLLKDDKGNFYKTNTLDIKLNNEDFDIEYDQSERKLLKPGHLFKYHNDDKLLTYKTEGKITDLVNKVENGEEFLYTNPFLMSVSKGGIVGYYLNSMDKRIVLDYSYVNSDSLVQFICNSLYLKRNTLLGEEEYEMKLIMYATDRDIDSPLFDDEGNDTGRIRVKIAFQDSTGKESCYIDAKLESLDRKTMNYTFVAKLKTDDYISLNEKLRVFDVKRMSDGSTYVNMIPMRNLKMNIYTFFRYDDYNASHKFDHLENLKNFVLTNSYSTGSNGVSLVEPLNMLKSNMKYKHVVEDNSYHLLVKSVPLIRAYDVLDYARYMYMISMLEIQYDHMVKIMDKKVNNYSVDMKFYNSYGRSRTFGVDDELNPLDVVNCKIRFKVATITSINTEDLLLDMKIFIKEYFENINGSTLNAIYVSNLIQAMENEFSDIKYIKFVGINGYNSSVQNIETTCNDITQLSKLDRLNYVPEFLNIDLNNIIIELIN